MIQRVRQFVRAVTARVTQADRDYVARVLPASAYPGAQELFYRMHPADQVHALNVARTAEQLATGCRVAVDMDLLLRAALLHDVGREKGDLDIWGKVFCVLMYHYLPSLARHWQCAAVRYPWQRIGHALYVYEHHPVLGAGRLRRIGMDAEADIIERHHERPLPEQPVELRLLGEADERN